MRFSTVSLVACLFACLAVSAPAITDDHANYVEVYGVCKNASEEATPGGWVFASDAALEKNKDILKHAKAKAEAGDIGPLGYKCEDKKTNLHRIKIACHKVVGSGYVITEYGAIALVTCKGKWAGTRMHNFDGKFKTKF